jgi:A-factor type gamma-butyrolactone 1'-reductase (1S-forming)
MVRRMGVAWCGFGSSRNGAWVVDEIIHNGGSAEFIQADLTQPDQVRLVVPFTLKAFGRLDYAFNNAGISGNNQALVDQTEENFDRLFAVNVKALFLLLQDELKQMIVQGEGGSIVNGASVGGSSQSQLLATTWPASTLSLD